MEIRYLYTKWLARSRMLLIPMVFFFSANACTHPVRPAAAAFENTGLPTAAPAGADYLKRNATIAFWENTVHENGPDDQISPRQLADQYLQRYRESGDIGDVLRAGHSARLSLAAQPRDNLSAELTLVDVDLTLHHFHEALDRIHAVERITGTLPGLRLKEAGLELELGAYEAAAKILAGIKPADRDDAFYIVESREHEETGRLTQARRELGLAAADINAEIDAPVQRRAWFFFRLGEMAFNAGDVQEAVADENRALQLFPRDADASRTLARIACAQKRWQACLQAAVVSANEIPYPETLGLEVDAQHGLGNDEESRRAQDLIFTIAAVGNSQHIADRLLAVEYSEHHIRPRSALRIAQNELTVRDDIYTEDTLAWAAAMAEDWPLARTAIDKAVRFRTENSLIDYHAGIILNHFGKRDQARAYLQQALKLNPQFHQSYADKARALLSQLGSTS